MLKSSAPHTGPTAAATKAGQLSFQDLHRPVQPWGVALKNALLSLLTLNKKLNLDQIMFEACKQTGLQDFGDEDRMPFREAFSIFLEDANAACFTPSGKLAVEKIVVDLLANRLKIVQLVKDHPEIEDEVLEDPVFIAGFPRTGTTHLHRALSNCSEFRFLKYFEVKHPVEEETEPCAAAAGKDPRIEQTAQELEMASRLSPLLNELHNISATDAEEEGPLMAMTGQSVTLFTLFPAPLYTKWYLSSNKTPAYEMLKLALQVIQWQDCRKGMEKKRFLLKWPPHIDAIPELMGKFPNAQVIKTHRDLRPVLLSCIYLQACRFGVYCEELDLHQIGRIFLDVIVARANDSVKNHCKDPKKVMNIVFGDYTQDNAGWIKSALRFLDVKCSDEDWLTIMDFLKASGGFRKDRARYDPESFGLKMNDVELQLSFYTDFLNNTLRA